MRCGRSHRIDPCTRNLDHPVAGADHIGVVARAAAQNVEPCIANQNIAQGIAGAIDVAGPEQGQVLDIRHKPGGECCVDGIDATIHRFDDCIELVYDIVIVAKLADQPIRSAPAIQRIAAYASPQPVVTAQTQQSVVTGEARDCVSRIRATQDVVARGATQCPVDDRRRSCGNIGRSRYRRREGRCHPQIELLRGLGRQIVPDRNRDLDACLACRKGDLSRSASVVAPSQGRAIHRLIVQRQRRIMSGRDLDGKDGHPATRPLADIRTGNGNGAVQRRPVIVQCPAGCHKLVVAAAEGGSLGVSEFEEEALVQLVGIIVVDIDRDGLDQFASGEDHLPVQGVAAVALDVEVPRRRAGERGVIHRHRVRRRLGQAQREVDKAVLRRAAALDGQHRPGGVVILDQCRPGRAGDIMRAGDRQPKAFGRLGEVVVNQVDLHRGLGLAGKEGDGPGLRHVIRPGLGAVVEGAETEAAVVGEGLRQADGEDGLAARSLGDHRVRHGDGPVVAGAVIVQPPADRRQAVSIVAEGGSLGVSEFEEEALVQLVGIIVVDIDRDGLDQFASGEDHLPVQGVAAVALDVEVPRRRAGERGVIHRHRVRRRLGQAQREVDKAVLRRAAALDGDDRHVP